MASSRRFPSLAEKSCSDIPSLLQADEVEVGQKVEKFGFINGVRSYLFIYLSIAARAKLGSARRHAHLHVGLHQFGTPVRNQHVSGQKTTTRH